MALVTEERPKVKWSELTKGSDGMATPVFSSSHSRVQSASTIPSQKSISTGQEKNAQKQGPVFSNSAHESHGFLARMKNAVKPKNLVGTVMGAGFIYSWGSKFLGNLGISLFDKGTHKFKPSMDLEFSQKPTLDKILSVGIGLGLIQNLLFFGTMRGTEIPEGNHFMEKVSYSLRHPDRHSLHFSAATMGVVAGGISTVRTIKGIKGFMETGSLSPKKEGFKENIWMLVPGLAGFAGMYLGVSGIFGIKKEAGAKTQIPPAASKEGETIAEKEENSIKGLIKSFSPKHLKEMAQYAWKNDKKGLSCRGLMSILETAYIVDGALLIQKDPIKNREAGLKSIIGGIMGIGLSLLQTHFVYHGLSVNTKNSASK